MKYAYEDLHFKQFESLVVHVSYELFGIGTSKFADGPDGGRDAKFVGKANMFPSLSDPWEGTTVIQAKHTSGINKHCLERDFFNPDGGGCVISKELPRIAKLMAAGDLDNYVIFANRKVTGGAGKAIVDHIAKASGLDADRVALKGVEDIESLLDRFRGIPANLDLLPFEHPLSVDPDDLSEVVQALARNKGVVDNLPPPPERTRFADKNRVNNLSAGFAKLIQARYLPQFPEIDAFLSHPGNADVLEAYSSAAEEFQAKIVAKRRDYDTFDEVLNYVVDLLISRAPELRTPTLKRLTRTVVFYMYWSCDIGNEE